MSKYKAMIAGVAVLAVPALCSAAVVTLTTGDGFGNSSFNTAGNWSDAQAPSSANDYEVYVQWLRTPTANGGTYTFAGNSLTIGSGGGFIFKSDDSTHNINDLILADGGIIWGGNTGGNTGTVLNGNITAVGTGSTIFANQSSYTINSDIGGAGDLTLDGSNANYLNLAGTLSMSGALYVAHVGNFTSASQIDFVIGASGVNNDVSGAGTAAFDGTFAFDLTSAGTTMGDSWTVAGVTSQTFGGTFAVTGFTEQGDGTTWLGSANGAEYAFDETTGSLSVIPEPATLGLIGIFGAGMLVIRRRFLI